MTRKVKNTVSRNDLVCPMSSLFRSTLKTKWELLAGSTHSFRILIYWESGFLEVHMTGQRNLVLCHCPRADVGMSSLGLEPGHGRN